MRTHSETLLEQIYRKQVLKTDAPVLVEASVFAKYFEMPGKAMETIHDEIGITADAVPERPIDVSKSDRPFDPTGMKQQRWSGRGLASTPDASLGPKHKELRKVFERGDGLFVVNPETNTRVIIKHKTENPYQSPATRDSRHVPKQSTYNVWIFDEAGDLRKKINCPMTGRTERIQYVDPTGKIATGAPIVMHKIPEKGVYVEESDLLAWKAYEKNSSLSPPATYTSEELQKMHNSGQNIIFVEPIPKDASSNMYVRYVDQTDAKAFIIPNTAFRATKKDDLGYVGVSSYRTSLNKVSTPVRPTREISKLIINKYGKAIKAKIQSVLEPLKNGIVDVLSDLRVDTEVVQKLITDYRTFLKLQNDVSQLDLATDIANFLDLDTDTNARVKGGNIGDYGITTRDGVVFFKSEESFNQFLREFTLAYIKTFTSTQTEEAVVDSMVDIF